MNFNPEKEKALAPICVKLGGKITDDKDVQPLKAPYSILVTDGGILIDWRE